MSRRFNAPGSASEAVLRSLDGRPPRKRSAIVLDCPRHNAGTVHQALLRLVRAGWVEKHPGALYALPRTVETKETP